VELLRVTDMGTEKLMTHLESVMRGQRTIAPPAEPLLSSLLPLDVQSKHALDLSWRLIPAEELARQITLLDFAAYQVACMSLFLQIIVPRSSLVAPLAELAGAGTAAYQQEL
jgi:hypothetical protein